MTTGLTSSCANLKSKNFQEGFFKMMNKESAVLEMSSGIIV
jgi:hypothetical protein